MRTPDERSSLLAQFKRALPMAAIVVVGSVACAMPMPPPAPTAAVASTGCQADNDCKGSRICKAGACVSAGMPDEMRANIDAGDISVAALQAAIQNNDCHPFSGLEPVLKQIEDQEQRAIFMSKLAARSTHREPEKAFGEWLFLVDKRAQLCPGGVTREQLAAVAKDTDAAVPEKEIDAAVRNTDCSALAAINSIDLWPFEQRFVNEVAKRQFQEAEVTRRLWLDTLETFEKECHKRLSRRESTEVQTSADKLRRIVGLDDDLLIGLRSKLMSAIAEGKADEVQKYLSAVTEREKALDTRNAAMYEAKMRTIKAELAEARAEAKVAAATAATKPATAATPAATPAAGGSSPSTAQQINDAVETTKAASQAVDVARSLFGF